LLRSFVTASAIGVTEVTGLGLGEFDDLWANAIELLHAKSGLAVDVPFAIRFGEFWSFVPRQLLPLEKGELSVWFLDTFHAGLCGGGGGVGFGALSEGVIGGGALEALLRGALLGLISGVFFVRYRRARQWWVFPLYLYLIVETFESVRDTTFRLLG